MGRWMDEAARNNSLGYAICEIQWDRGCTGRAVDGHEPLTRARLGSILDRSNVLLTCRYCHSSVHANPAEALDRGYLKSSWDGA